MVKDKELAKSFIHKLLTDIHKFCPLKNSNIKTYIKYNQVYYTISPIAVKFNNRIEKTLKFFKEIALKDHGYILSYTASKCRNMRLSTKKDSFDILRAKGYHYEYHIYLKDLHTKEVKPSSKVYHYSPKSNRESIMENGLLPKSSQESPMWAKEAFYEYPPIIFAVDSEELGWYYFKDGDKWEINTENLPNKWWEDLNATNVVNSKCIMTFEAIPAMYLKLLT